MYNISQHENVFNKVQIPMDLAFILWNKHYSTFNIFGHTFQQETHNAPKQEKTYCSAFYKLIGHAVGTYLHPIQRLRTRILIGFKLESDQWHCADCQIHVRIV